VGYGLRQQRPTPDKREQSRRIEEALGLVRLAGFGHRRSWELSGGQQQRVALARAIINHPTVLLLDEPLGALDLKLRREMQVELKQLQEQLGITFIFVTHDQDEALSMADRVAVMRDGRILQDGPPALIYDRPVDPWVASFIGHMNFLPGRVEEVGAGGTVRLERGPVLRGQLPEEPISVGEQALLAVRPERIWLTHAGRNGSGPDHPGNRFGARLVRTVFMGDKVEHVVDAPEVGTLVISAPNVEAPGGVAPAMGEEVVVGWTDDAARIIRERQRGA
jgi:spermidine/putrescine transport system ATP-binding protein